MANSFLPYYNLIITYGHILHHVLREKSIFAVREPFITDVRSFALRNRRPFGKSRLSKSIVPRSSDFWRGHPPVRLEINCSKTKMRTNNPPASPEFSPRRKTRGKIF